MSSSGSGGLNNVSQPMSNSYHMSSIYPSTTSDLTTYELQNVSAVCPVAKKERAARRLTSIVTPPELCSEVSETRNLREKTFKKRSATKRDHNKSHLPRLHSRSLWPPERAERHNGASPAARCRAPWALGVCKTSGKGPRAT